MRNILVHLSTDSKTAYAKCVKQKPFTEDDIELWECVSVSSAKNNNVCSCVICFTVITSSKECWVYIIKISN